MKMERTDKYKIKVLEKAFKILDLFDEKGKRLAAKEICELLSLNSASTFRILNNLERAGYLERDPETMKYGLGAKIDYLGSVAEPHTRIRRITRPFLKKLNQELDETVHLAVLHRGEALYLEKIEGKKTIRVITRVGMKLPAHCSGVGKVLLAALPEDVLEKTLKEKGLPRYTANTITDPKLLKAELAKVRRRGYAIDNEEIEEGLKCAAAPLLDSDGKVAAAISLSVPKERFDKGVARFVRKIKESAKEISEVLRKQGMKRDQPW